MKVLQVGLDWFEDKPGGLSRYYWATFQATQTRFRNRGLVLAESDVEARSEGRIRSFGRPTDGFLAKLRTSRRGIADAIREFEPDLVVSHFAPSIASSLDLVRRTPLITHFHGPWAGESVADGASRASARLKYGIERFVYSRSDRIVVLSEAFKQLLAETYGVPRARIHVIPGGVTASEFRVDASRDEAKRKVGLAPDRDYVFCIRRLVRRMGLENLVEAFGTLAAKHPGVDLLIGGQGALRQEIEAQAARLGLGGRVRCLGPVSHSDLPLLYRASIVSVVPTVQLEGFGLTTLESLAAGTPVITTPVGGLPEIMTRFDPRLVAAGSEPRQVGAILDHFLTHRDELPSAEACVAFAGTYDWSIIGDRLADFYASVARDPELTHARRPMPETGSDGSDTARSPALDPADAPTASARPRPTLSVVIVSYQRAQDLERCLLALSRQTVLPDDVNVICREDDGETIELLDRCKGGPLPIRCNFVRESGVVAARNIGLRTTTADIAAMIDDDTEPHPDWVERCRRHYADQPRLGALGGRDEMYVGETRIEGRRDTVGKLQWFGRVIGNHHLGHGRPRPVDTLKGANMSFRTSAVAGLAFNEMLRGDGAQPWEDAEFSLAVRRAGWSVMYDPNLVVRHNQGVRKEARHYAGIQRVRGRERYNYQCFCFNEVVTVWPSLRPHGRLAYLVFSTLVGTGLSPGLVQAFRLSRSMGLDAFDRFLLCQAGKWQAFKVLASTSLPRIVEPGAKR